MGPTSRRHTPRPTRPHTIHPETAIAVVLGLCVHGLATARSLWRHEVPVYALEKDPHMPGVHTRSARVHLTESLDGIDLVNTLLSLHAEQAFATRPVLFPINDRMTRTIAEHWTSLAPYYRVVWANEQDYVLSLLDKQNIEQRCQTVGLNYPATRYIRGREDMVDELGPIPYPVIVKPARPLSQFKAELVRDQQHLIQMIQQYSDSLPFLVQRWIPGDDDQIVFGALFLENGTIRARFEGAKLRSHPPAMGQTTAAKCQPDPEVHAATSEFFHGLPISGPVSLEFKRDRDGTLWVIEPTAGRTDFWVACCIENGVDLPWLTYRCAIGESLPVSQQRDRTIWMDSQRDPLIYLSLLARSPFRVVRRRTTFAYFRWRDPVPSIAGAKSLLVRQLDKRRRAHQEVESKTL